MGEGRRQGSGGIEGFGGRVGLGLGWCVDVLGFVAFDSQMSMGGFSLVSYRVPVVVEGFG